MGLCNYSKLNERIQEFVLPLSPTLHTPPSGPFSLSEALSTRGDVIGYKDVVNAHNAHRACTRGPGDGGSRYANRCPERRDNKKQKCNAASKEKERETKQRKRRPKLPVEEIRHVN